MPAPFSSLGVSTYYGLEAPAARASAPAMSVYAPAQPAPARLAPAAIEAAPSAPAVQAGSLEAEWADLNQHLGRVAAPAELTLSLRARGLPPFFDSESGMVFDGAHAFFYDHEAVARQNQQSTRGSASDAALATAEPAQPMSMYYMPQMTNRSTPRLGNGTEDAGQMAQGAFSTYYGM